MACYDQKELDVLSLEQEAIMLINLRRDWQSVPIWPQDLDSRDAHLPMSVEQYAKNHKLGASFIDEVYEDYLALKSDALRGEIRSFSEVCWNVSFNGTYWALDSVTGLFGEHQRPVVDHNYQKEIFCRTICAILCHNLQIIRPENMDDLDRQQ